MREEAVIAEEWSSRLTHDARQTWIIGVLGLAVLLQSGGLAYLIFREMPTHFIPPGGPGISFPGVIPETLATDFASVCLMQRYSFTPITLPQQHKAFLRCLDPFQHAAFEKKMQEEVVMVKEAKMSSQLVVLDAQAVSRHGTSLLVKVRAVRTIGIGGHQVREEAFSAEVTVLSWPHTGRPLGVVVGEVKNVVPPLSVSGT